MLHSDSSKLDLISIIAPQFGQVLLDCVPSTSSWCIMLTYMWLLLGCAAFLQASSCAGEWSVPLYLWRSALTSKSALLPTAPVLDTYGNYSLVFTEPVAFAYDTSKDECVSYPLVTLKLYYSSSRNDLQTTTWSLVQLNAHGGEYEYVSTIGAIASTPGAGYGASKYVPVTVSFNKDTQDAFSGPFSAADVNALQLVNQQQQDREGYGSGGLLAGFAYRGSCPSCSVGMSEAFPSAGGADCAYECNAGGATGLGCFDTTFRLGEMPPTDALLALKDSMTAADEAILKFGHKDVTVTPLSRGTSIHISFNYFCCYSAEDKAVINSVLAKHKWPEVEVTFDQPTIRIDSDAEHIEHYSVILLLDDASQLKLAEVMEGVEGAIRAAGVDVHVPRSQQEPFHSTLAVVPGRDFAAVAALEAVNVAVPPGTWSTPILLCSPSWH